MPAALPTEEVFLLDADRARELANRFGTPLYVLDEGGLRRRIRQYRAAFLDAWPNSELTYATKANRTLAVLAIAHQEGCLIDVASEGELRSALRAGVPASRCHLHGNNKGVDELRFAMRVGVHQIVVDNFPEIEEIARLSHELPCPEIVIRCAPGVDPITHARISTGQADTKFGFNVADGAAERALLRCLHLGLPVVGFHCHVGSQLLDPQAQISGGQVLGSLARDVHEQHGFRTSVINVGGGLGVRYTAKDQPTDVAQYCRLLVQGIRSELGELSPTLVQEPGRSLIAEAGVTLYRVGVVKNVPAGEGRRTYVVVDGGLSDNPRPAMYGSQYTVLHVPAEGRGDSGHKLTARVSGKHCETDTLFENIEFPTSVERGDLVQVLCTGAYNSSMANTYNAYPRPATVLLRENGEVAQVQRRETWDELDARDSLPEGL